MATIIGKTNPKFAKRQLGITDKIFERYYNQPLLDDRLERRDPLPRAGWTPRKPEETAGAALVAFRRGKLTRDQVEDAVAKARHHSTTPPMKHVEEPSGYDRLPRFSDRPGIRFVAGNGHRPTGNWTRLLGSTIPPAVMPRTRSDMTEPSAWNHGV